MTISIQRTDDFSRLSLHDDKTTLCKPFFIIFVFPRAMNFHLTFRFGQMEQCVDQISQGHKTWFGKG